MLGALPWLLILLHLIFRRGFVVLLLWLLVAPVVMYFVDRPLDRQTLLFQTSGTDVPVHQAGFYEEAPAVITLEKLINPNRTIFMLFFVIFVLNAVLKRTRWVPLDRTEKWMSVFSVILLVNILLRSERLAFGLHVGVDAFIVPFCSYFVIRRFVNNQDRFHQLMCILAYMGVYVIVFCLIERVTRADLDYRVTGLFGNKDVLGVIMIVVFFTTLLDALCNGQMPAKKQALPCVIRRFVIAMAPVVILLTLTRGNWVGFLSGMFVFCLLGRRLAGVSRQLGAVGLTLIMITITAPSVALFVPGELMETRVLDQDNVLGRFATWVATIQLAREAPILGVGLNDLHGLLAREKVSFGEFTNFTTPHNSLLSIFVELGAVGLLAYLALILTITRMGLNLYRRGAYLKDQWRGVALVSIMLAYLTPSLFSNTIYITGLIHVYVYVFAGAIAGLYGPLCSTSTQYAFSLVARRRAAYQLPNAVSIWNRRSVERQYER
jgi:O-antigen ligase